MNSIVHNVLPIESRFIAEVLVELFVDIVFDALETIVCVQRIAIAWSIDDGHFQLYSFFNYVQLFLFDC